MEARPEGGDVAVLEEDQVLGVAHESERIGGQERAALDDPQAERRALTCAHQGAVVGDGQGGDRIVAAHARQGAAHRIDQGRARRQLAADELGQHLGVRLGDELDALLAQLLAQLEVVLDDPVVDQGHMPAHVGVGMGVDRRRRTVGRPARVANSYLRAVERAVGEHSLESLQPPRLASDRDPAVRADRHPRAVVAAVLQGAQPREQAVEDRPLAQDGSHDAAHD